MKLHELLEGIAVVSSGVAPDTEVRSVVSDSRQVRPGDLFVALRGLRHDGGRFAGDALDRGAIAVVCDADAEPSLTRCVRVRDARAALGWLASARHGRPSQALCMTGVTGTNGKTTTAALLGAMLRAAGRPTGLLTTVQYEIGARVIPAARTTPEASTLQRMLADMRAAGCSHGVMEVSSHALVQQRVAGIRFQVGVFTNLTRDHLDYHGDMESYFAAKSLLFEHLAAARGTLAVINADDSWGRRLSQTLGGGHALHYGIDAGDFRAENVSLGAGGSTFTLWTPDGVRRAVRCSLPGRFNVYNFLAATAAAWGLNVPLDDILDKVSAWAPRWGRMERIPVKRDIDVFVDYAHTDDALENVLTTLRELTLGKLYVVFGCGGDRDRGKRPLMGAVAARLADGVVLTADNPRSELPARIIEEIMAGMPANRPPPIVVLDRREAIAKALALARKGDCVLVAGKGHEPYQEFASHVVPFDDRETIRSIVSHG